MTRTKLLRKVNEDDRHASNDVVDLRRGLDYVNTHGSMPSLKVHPRFGSLLPQLDTHVCS